MPEDQETPNVQAEPRWVNLSDASVSTLQRTLDRSLGPALTGRFVAGKRAIEYKSTVDGDLNLLQTHEKLLSALNQAESNKTGRPTGLATASVRLKSDGGGLVGYLYFPVDKRMDALAVIDYRDGLINQANEIISGTGGTRFVPKQGK